MALARVQAHCNSAIILQTTQGPKPGAADEDMHRNLSSMAIRRKLNRTMYLKQQKLLCRASELQISSHKKLIQTRQERPKPCTPSCVDFWDTPLTKFNRTISVLKPPQPQVQSRLRFQAKTLEGWKKVQGISKHTKVFVIEGKYPAVREALLARQWVENKDLGSTFCHLYWSRKARIPQGLRDYQVYNHFPSNYQLCIKYNLVKHLRSLPRTHGIEWRSFFPRSFRMHQWLKSDFIDMYKAIVAASLLKEHLNQPSAACVEKVMTALGICQRWIYALDLGLKEEGLVTTNEWQLLNSSHQMEVTYLFNKLGSKVKSLSRSEVSTLVKSTLLRLETVDSQCGLNGSKNIWILKPGGKSRGRGIKLSNSLEGLAHLIDSPECWVIQKYIENPLIIDSRKFDIRQWVLVTYFGSLNIYFYSESYLRFCVDEWSLGTLNTLSVHLTNNSISKKSSNYHKTAIPGSMWHSAQFEEFLTAQKGPYAWPKLKSRMEQIVKWCFLSVTDLGNKGKNAFELFGFDFMVDVNLNPWLIEVNSSPSMEYSTPITEALVKEMLDDSIKVVVDHHMNGAEYNGKFKLIHTSP